jgi:hypothetical protein
MDYRTTRNENSPQKAIAALNSSFSISRTPSTPFEPCNIKFSEKEIALECAQYIVGQPIYGRASNEDGSCSKRQSFEDIGSQANSTIQINLAASVYSLDNLWQHINLQSFPIILIN